MGKLKICILIVACLLIVALDGTAGFLAYKAQVAQNKAKHVNFLFAECRKPSHEAYDLGSAAIILLGASHVVAHLGGGCGCCFQTAFCRKTFLSIKWILFAAGMLLLVVGTMSNHHSNTTCGFKFDHFLSWGATMCLAHGVAAVCYCLTSALA